LVGGGIHYISVTAIMIIDKVEVKGILKIKLSHQDSNFR
jgi:hypothetical protein